MVYFWIALAVVSGAAVVWRSIRSRRIHGAHDVPNVGAEDSPRGGLDDASGYGRSRYETGRTGKPGGPGNAF